MFNGNGHGRSHSQVNLRTEAGGTEGVHSPDNHHQHYPYANPSPNHTRVESGYHTPVNRTPLSRAQSPTNIIIPQFKGRPQSGHASMWSEQHHPSAQSSPNSSSPSRWRQSSGTPITPSTCTTADEGEEVDSATPTSAGTSMSRTSAIGARDQRRKSEPERIPSGANALSTLQAASANPRKFSVDAALWTTTTTMNVGTSSLMNNTNAPFQSADSPTLSEGSDQEWGNYVAKKPKASLVRVFKQIINPKKAAEMDAIKNKNEHFAWIEMQKSLRRVSSPDPAKDRVLGVSGYFSPKDGSVPESGDASGCGDAQDPFVFLKKCQVMRDTTAPTSNLLDFGPNTFVQVDKVARNVNQRGPHLTPQLLSQKYLTRPYSKATLSKLRVLFIWVSENIRLEGGPTRDVSGGRYKLGPAGEYMAALSASTTAGVIGGGLMTEVGDPSSALRPVGGIAPPASIYMAGVEDYARGFLQEDAPELAQDVLTSRISRTGEGFANLFAEMAVAAGIEDVGVVKGYVKGPMDVFTNEVPQPNHAWNVVRIDGTYRFIDCCLASPSHPVHYPNRLQGGAATPFYFLTSPADAVLSHFPMFLTYQYITPSIPPNLFLKLPYIRPAYFDCGLSFVDFKNRTKLDVKDEEPIEILLRIDGTGAPGLGGSNGSGGFAGQMLSSDCLGKSCGEGIELRAEVEAMTMEGKLVRKRALAQVMVLNPYDQLLMGSSLACTSSVSVNGVGTGASSRQLSALQHTHWTGIRIVKIKAVLPAETVVSPGEVRKGIVHIYAGRKAPTDAAPYPLALSLPIRHTGTMPKTPFNFVLPHFSPYEFYVKAPQAELLYHPHTYHFCIVSLAAQSQSATASAMVEAAIVAASEASSPPLMPPSIRPFQSSSSLTLVTPVYRTSTAQPLQAASQTLQQSRANANHFGAIVPSGLRTGGNVLKTHPYQHYMSTAAASSSSQSVNVLGGMGSPSS
ncbi:cytokinesis protein 3, partial [Lunasporangiospora selenospora]